MDGVIFYFIRDHLCVFFVYTQRTVIVPPEYGYGDVGEQEIGPGQTFELQIELLAVG